MTEVQSSASFAMGTERRFVTLETAAMLTNFSSSYIERLCRDGHVPCACGHAGQVFPAASELFSLLKVPVHEGFDVQYVPESAIASPSLSREQTLDSVVGSSGRPIGNLPAEHVAGDDAVPVPLRSAPLPIAIEEDEPAPVPPLISASEPSPIPSLVVDEAPPSPLPSALPEHWPVKTNANPAEHFEEGPLFPPLAKKEAVAPLLTREPADMTTPVPVDIIIAEPAPVAPPSITSVGEPAPASPASTPITFPAVVAETVVATPVAAPVTATVAHEVSMPLVNEVASPAIVALEVSGEVSPDSPLKAATAVAAEQEPAPPAKTETLVHEEVVAPSASVTDVVLPETDTLISSVMIGDEAATADPNASGESFATPELPAATSADITVDHISADNAEASVVEYAPAPSASVGGQEAAVLSEESGAVNALDVATSTQISSSVIPAPVVVVSAPRVEVPEEPTGAVISRIVREAEAGRTALAPTVNVNAAVMSPAPAPAPMPIIPVPQYSIDQVAKSAHPIAQPPQVVPFSTVSPAAYPQVAAVFTQPHARASEWLPWMRTSHWSRSQVRAATGSPAVEVTANIHAPEAMRTYTPPPIIQTAPAPSYIAPATAPVLATARPPQTTSPAEGPTPINTPKMAPLPVFDMRPVVVRIASPLSETQAVASRESNIVTQTPSMAAARESEASARMVQAVEDAGGESLKSAEELRAEVSGQVRDSWDAAFLAGLS